MSGLHNTMYDNQCYQCPVVLEHLQAILDGFNSHVHTCYSTKEHQFSVKSTVSTYPTIVLHSPVKLYSSATKW